MSLIAWLFILLGAAAVLVFSVLIVRLRLLRKGLLSHALGLALFRIQLPAELKGEESQNSMDRVREKIALMEQVLSQLSRIKTSGLKKILYGPLFFCLEVAVPNNEKLVHFYLSVPRQYASSVEKVIQGTYHDAHVEPVKDYTIFSPDGFVAAATVKAKDKFLPIKTYKRLESDPLGSILNAFSKAGDKQEGLALQLVLQTAPASAAHHLTQLASALRGGKNLREAQAHVKKSSIAQAKKDLSQEEEKVQPPKPVEEKLLEQVQEKAHKTLFLSNIRLLASAQDEKRAQDLLEELMTPLEQFQNGDINSLQGKIQKGRVRQRLVYEFSFRLPSRLNQSYLSSEELASLWHLPNTVLGSPHLATTKAKFAPSPTHMSQEGLLLGINEYRAVETKIYLKEEDRARHFYVIGQTGTGKSVFLQNLAIQDVKAGKGVCFIDPHGDAVEEILTHIPPQRIRDLIYFNPADVERPMGMNLLEYDPRFPEQKTFIINELLEIFNKLYDMKVAGGPMFEQYFRNATALVMDDPESGNTLLEINRVFVDKAFRDYKLSRTNNPLVKTFWKEVAEKAGGEASLANIVPYISSKFDSFLSNEIMRPIVAQEKSAFNLREVLDTEKILLINLSKGRLGELNSSLIGLIMVGKILMAAFSRADIADKNLRKPFYLYID
ncbi:MAG: DUF87 domain-containing protein, partial [Candidatus Harrisonbacteria bacterium]|nr:DUF87 domain-containing protein [Candidatus Harrisonbacteria bacterium]